MKRNWFRSGMAGWCSMLILAWVPVFSGGCRSDGYYQDRAVESAREFLLEEAPDIPLMEQEYIKFNRPFLLVSPITGGYSTGVVQICVCWMVPDNPEIYMVFGTSGNRMIQWSPVRVIRKSFDTPDLNYLVASRQASDAILQSMFGLLTVEEANHVRFTLPGVWRCAFPLDSNPESALSPEALENAEKLPRYALAWVIHENDVRRYVVRVGTAQDDTLKGFTPYFSGIYSEEDFWTQLTDPNPVREPFGGEVAKQPETAGEEQQ